MERPWMRGKDWLVSSTLFNWIVGGSLSVCSTELAFLQYLLCLDMCCGDMHLRSIIGADHDLRYFLHG